MRQKLRLSTFLLFGFWGWKIGPHLNPTYIPAELIIFNNCICVCLNTFQLIAHLLFYNVCRDG